jgi:hypothetical protein
MKNYEKRTAEVNKMEYLKFVNELRCSVMSEFGLEQEKCWFEQEGGIHALAGDRLFIVCEENTDGREVCGFRTKELYQDYRQGEDMTTVISRIRSQLARIQDNGIMKKMRDITDYEKVKDDLFIRALNLERNRNNLETAVYQTVGDIALVVYRKLDCVGSAVTSIRIQKEYLETWGLTSEQVFTAALENTSCMTPPRIYCWQKMLIDSNYSGESFMQEQDNLEMEIDRGCTGNCLSTTEKTNGAVAIFMPGVAKCLADAIGSDIYLAFTSIHEVMVHNAEKVDKEALEEVVAETIKAATPEEDYLTSRIYRYDRENGRFSIV